MVKLRENVPMWLQYKKLKKAFAKLEKKFETVNEKAVVTYKRMFKKAKSLQGKIDFIER